ncbi:hypothetical protein, partial [Streptomyces sp. NPDC001480]|uniref:hypothetical protein n=1 Tax=Streptomyces sp. NPDC001480 TaxID=3364577 RepID=UPI0036AE653C
MAFAVLVVWLRTRHFVQGAGQQSAHHVGQVPECARQYTTASPHRVDEHGQGEWVAVADVEQVLVELGGD